MKNILTTVFFIIIKLHSTLGNHINAFHPKIIESRLDLTGFICSPVTFYASPTYDGGCTKFVICYKQGQGYVKHCFLDKAFDKNQPPCDGNTNNHDGVNRCRPEQNNQKDVYSFSPTKYNLCSGGQFFVKDCGPQEFYSISRHYCLPANLVPAHDRVREMLNTSPSEGSNIYCPLDLLGVYPHPFTNQKYIKCVYGELIIKDCRPGTVYNFLTKFCEGNDNLIGNQAFLTCPTNVYGNFIHPFDCEKYIACTPHGTEIKSCPNSIFSIKWRTCLSYTQILANDHIECRSPLRNGNEDNLGVFCFGNNLGLLYPHPSNWHKYIVCENNMPKVLMCPKSQVFDIETRKCVNQSKVMNEDGEV